MHLSKQQFKQLINEELNKLLLEIIYDTVNDIELKSQGEDKHGVKSWSVWYENIEIGEIMARPGAKWETGGESTMRFLSYDMEDNLLGIVDTQDEAIKFFVSAGLTKKAGALTTDLAVHNDDQLIQHMWMDRHERRAVIENSPLKDNKIISKIGKGVYGTAFLLDNDHVLKLFQAGLEGTERELEHYRDLETGQRMGAAEPNEPAIYDFGQAPKTSWHYVEMSKVIPLEDWFRMTGREKKIPDLRSVGVNSKTGHALAGPLVYFKDNLTAITAIQYRKKDIFDKAFKTSLLRLMNEYTPKFLAAGMTKEEVDQYFRAVLQLINKHGLGRVYDVHHQNVGVMPRSGRPDEFVIFDF